MFGVEIKVISNQTSMKSFMERAFPLGLHLMINLIISPFLIKTVRLTGMGEHFAFSRDKLIE